MKAFKQFLKDIYGISAKSVDMIDGGLVNTNYKATSENGVYVFKQYNQKSRDEVQFEIDVLQELESSDVPSPQLIMSKSGKVLSEFEGKPYVVYGYIQGNTVESMNELQLKQVGVLMGKLHASLKDFQPSVKKSAWEIDELKKLVKDSTESLHERGYANAKELISFVYSELEKFNFSNILPKGITHQDIKPENILIHEGSISGIIDFDNSYHGTLLDDIATTIIWTCFEDGELIQSRVDALLTGYESIRPLETEESESFKDRIRFRLLREVFISPYAATNPNDANARSDYFKKLYTQFV
jgi:homoserine kinase type II